MLVFLVWGYRWIPRTHHSYLVSAQFCPDLEIFRAKDLQCQDQCGHRESRMVNV